MGNHREIRNLFDQAICGSTVFSDFCFNCVGSWRAYLTACAPRMHVNSAEETPYYAAYSYFKNYA